MAVTFQTSDRSLAAHLGGFSFAHLLAGTGDRRGTGRWRLLDGGRSGRARIVSVATDGLARASGEYLSCSVEQILSNGECLIYSVGQNFIIDECWIHSVGQNFINGKHLIYSVGQIFTIDECLIYSVGQNLSNGRQKRLSGTEK